MARTKGFKGATELMISAGVLPLVRELDENEKKVEAKRLLEAAQAHERATVELANQTMKLKLCPHCSSWVTPTVETLVANTHLRDGLQWIKLACIMLVFLIVCFPLVFLLILTLRKHEKCPNCKGRIRRIWGL